MANKEGHRRFGSVRRLTSGRWQARYPGPDGRLRPAPDTYPDKKTAERYLTLVEASMMKGDWIDPSRAKIKLVAYAERWIEQRPNLRPRTLQLYRWTLKKHITPYLGEVELGKLSPALVREWRSKLLAEGISSGMVAKAYRLLRAVLWTAVKEDELLRTNPCRIPGADKESAEERPHLNLTQVTRLMKAVPERYRLMVLLAAMASLRFGEITALQRQDVDLDAATIRVRQQYLEVRGEGLTLGPPKSRAGVRTVAIPIALVTLLRAHLDEHCASAPDALLFSLESGLPIRRSSFNKLTTWRTAVASIGVPDLHFHDLRHTGNMLAAGSKVTTKDLMARMGHDSMQAALIYQHASREADLSIAAHLNKQLEGLDPAKKKKPKTKKKDSKATKAKAMRNLNGVAGELEASPGIDGRSGLDQVGGTDDQDGGEGTAGVLVGGG
jgi:integrase